MCVSACGGCAARFGRADAPVEVSAARYVGLYPVLKRRQPRNWTLARGFFRDASRGFSQTTTTRPWPRKSPRSRSMRASPRSSSLTCPISAIGSRSRAFPRFGGQRLGHLAAGGSTTTRSWSKELSRRGCPTNAVAPNLKQLIVYAGDELRVLEIHSSALCGLPIVRYSCHYLATTSLPQFLASA